MARKKKVEKPIEKAEEVISEAVEVPVILDEPGQSLTEEVKVQDEIQDVTINESMSLQKQGWEVFGIYVKDNITRHKLKRVSEG